MKFISAQWAYDALGGKQIRALDEDGKEHFVPSETTDVPPWPQYIAEGGTIEEPNAP